MSVRTTIEAPPPRVEQTEQSARVGYLILGCLALGLLSLLIPSTITYDPFAWANWARQIVHFHLDTRGGPAWKPLPVFFDLPFAPFGNAAIWAWLAVARAGGILSVAMSYRLARRLGGRGAGLFAAVGVLTSTSFLFYLMVVGVSEPLLAGLALLAIERHLDRHHGHAAVLLYACMLLRPEFLAAYLVYGAWLWRRRPLWRKWLALGVLMVPVLLLLPDYIGSGDWLRSSKRAAIPSEGGPLLTSVPAWAVLQSATRAVIVPVLAGAGMAAVIAVRNRHERLLLWLCGLCGATLLWEAGLTQIHKSAGDERYLIVSYLLGCVMAGVGWSRLVGRFQDERARRLVAAAACVVIAPFVWAEAVHYPGDRIGMLYQVRKDGQLETVIAQMGGPSRVLACGRIMADTYQVGALAWYLDVPISRLTVVKPPPANLVASETTGTLFRTSTFGNSPYLPALPDQSGFHVVAEDQQWQVFSTC